MSYSSAQFSLKYNHWELWYSKKSLTSHKCRVALCKSSKSATRYDGDKMWELGEECQSIVVAIGLLLAFPSWPHPTSLKSCRLQHILSLLWKHGKLQVSFIRFLSFSFFHISSWEKNTTPLFKSLSSGIWEIKENAIVAICILNRNAARSLG